MILDMTTNMQVEVDEEYTELEARWRIVDEITAMYQQEQQAFKTRFDNRVRNYLKQLEGK